MTSVTVLTPLWIPDIKIRSKVVGVFSKTNLPSTIITASLGGISTSFITRTSLVNPVLLDSLL